MRMLLLLAWVCAVCASCASRGTRGPAGAIAPEPAPTPSAAVIRVWEASASGDEAAYRRAVLFRPPSQYAEAQARLQLASARLHRTVRKHEVTGQRVRSAGFDRNEKLLVHAPPTAEDMDKARRWLEKTGWTIEGNVANPADGSDNPTRRVERLGDGWIVVETDSADIDAEAAHVLTEDAAMTADLVDAATARVRAGKLRTIREVNDFVDGGRKAASERAVAKLQSGEPMGPVVAVVDDETGHPVAGAEVGAKFLVPPARLKWLSVTTDQRGRARFPAKPDTIHSIDVTAPGYARRYARLATVKGTAGGPDEIHVTIGKAVVVEVTLVLPDERRAALSIFEGTDDDPAPRGLGERLEPKRITLPVRFEDAPPPLPEHNPMLRLHLPSASPHKYVEGVVHRVTSARTAAGREIPVFRDAPPPNETTFGLYQIGSNGFGDTVFVIGTLADARAADAAAMKFQWTRNDHLLGPATQPATQP